MRDLADNCIIICSIENFDAMGVHTGDSITVAPAQTLTDREYQMMRDGAIRCLREIGVDTGGSNVQFAINPTDGRMVIIEMNPRVSRSLALASKATGFPIAKIAAKLAVGYTLDEIPNDITQGWHDLRAVRTGRVYLADGNQYFNRPGPRVVETFQALISPVPACANITPADSNRTLNMILHVMADSSARPA